MRCFLAIELPDRVVRACESAGESLRALEPTWAEEKWVRTGVLHLTLKFLGEVDDGVVECIAEDLRGAVTSCAAFRISITGLRAVPGTRRARMIWAGVQDDTGGCAALASLADKIGAAYGVEQEARRFVPHITLVRARHPKSIRLESLVMAARVSGLSDEVGNMSVLSASLFSSTLTARGPVHERLHEFALRSASDR